MKKLVCVIAALFLLAGAFAYAETTTAETAATETATAETPAAETTVSAVNWSDFEAYANSLGGQFYELDGLGIKMFVPADMSYVEFEDYFAMFINEEQTKTVLVDVRESGVKDLNEFAAAVTEAGATDAEIEVINGLPGVTYLLNGALCLSFLTDGGYYISFYAAPVAREELTSGEGFVLEAFTILSSIQTVE